MANYTGQQLDTILTNIAVQLHLSKLDNSQVHMEQAFHSLFNTNKQLCRLLKTRITTSDTWRADVTLILDNCLIPYSKGIATKPTTDLLEELKCVMA